MDISPLANANGMGDAMTAWSVVVAGFGALALIAIVYAAWLDRRRR